MPTKIFPIFFVTATVKTEGKEYQSELKTQQFIWIYQHGHLLKIFISICRISTLPWCPVSKGSWGGGVSSDCL